MEVVGFHIIIEILLINFYFNLHISTVCWIDFIILEYHFNDYWIITRIVLLNSEPNNKLFTTTEDATWWLKRVWYTNKYVEKFLVILY
jgi:hypothetical protein